jgi:hypothetical protein
MTRTTTHCGSQTHANGSFRVTNFETGAPATIPLLTLLLPYPLPSHFFDLPMRECLIPSQTQCLHLEQGKFCATQAPTSTYKQFIAWCRGDPAKFNYHKEIETDGAHASSHTLSPAGCPAANDRIRLLWRVIRCGLRSTTNRPNTSVYR